MSVKATPAGALATVRGAVWAAIAMLAAAVCFAACEAPGRVRPADWNASPGCVGTDVAPDLVVRGKLTVRWSDAGGAAHSDQVDVRLWLRGSAAIACDVSALGSRVAWIGGDGTEWWVFEKRDDGMHLTRGTIGELLAALAGRDAGRGGMTEALMLLALPGLARNVLGLSAELPDAAGWSFAAAWSGSAGAGGCLPGAVSIRAESAASEGISCDWEARWSGAMPIGGAGTGQGVLPSRIDLLPEEGGVASTLEVGDATPGGGKDALFQLESLKASLRPVAEHQATAAGGVR